MFVPNPQASFVLLDDRSAGQGDARSRLYTDWVKTLDCTDASALPQMLDDMQAALGQGLHAVAHFSYELGAGLAGVAYEESDWPMAQVLLFRHCARLSDSEVTAWLDGQAGEDEAPTGVANLQANVDQSEFEMAIERIRAYIAAGDTYQVNYTYRLHFDAFGSPLSLYRRLRERQPVPFGALMALPCGRAVLSLSPELFICNDADTLTARPMKGTAPATGDAAQDEATATALANDVKNRAENLMIVDMLRNDLGRIAETGSVMVTDLFDVNRYGDVLQMTSTVQAQLRPEAALEDVFRAVYPCGSITGAPKHRTMQIIDEIEAAPRGLYTGAIGWFDAPADDPSIGDFCLSVPIRTLMLQAAGKGGVRKGELGVGAGIVHDSNARDEYAECRLKARFLTDLPQEFELIETMRLEYGRCLYLDLHLQRLGTSARYFGFDYDESAIRKAVARLADELPAGAHRLRLALGEGGFEFTHVPLAPITQPVSVLVSAYAVMDSNDLFLQHKTTVRAQYDEAWKEAEKQGAFDTLFFNQRGELTEGGRCNVFVKLDGKWFTPPLSSGVLPGVMRSVVLSDPAWNAGERVLTRDDLRNAQEVMVCNALRGVMAAKRVFCDPVKEPLVSAALSFR